MDLAKGVFKAVVDLEKWVLKATVDLGKILTKIIGDLEMGTKIKEINKMSNEGLPRTMEDTAMLGVGIAKTITKTFRASEVTEVGEVTEVEEVEEVIEEVEEGEEMAIKEEVATASREIIGEGIRTKEETNMAKVKKTKCNK